MTRELKAIAVHLFTAIGAICAMLAMLAAVEEEWGLMYVWLVVAFIVDGIDGPLARRYDVKRYAKQIDGVLMDLIIDYLTYVFIPAYALFKSGILPGWTGWIAIILITYASALYFADSRMKTKDNSFAGFPGCWNMVVVVLFATEPNFWITLVLVVALAIGVGLARGLDLDVVRRASEAITAIAHTSGTTVCTVRTTSRARRALPDGQTWSALRRLTYQKATTTTTHTAMQYGQRASIRYRL